MREITRALDAVEGPNAAAAAAAVVLETECILTMCVVRVEPVLVVRKYEPEPEVFECRMLSRRWGSNEDSGGAEEVLAVMAMVETMVEVNESEEGRDRKRCERR